MATFSLVGGETLTIQPSGGAARVIADFADASIVEVDFQSELINTTTGKNGNGIAVLDERGRNGAISFRIVKGSADDNYINGLFNAMKNNFVATKFLTISFSRSLIDGSGAVLTETYVFEGALFSQMPKAMANVHGDTEQAIAVWSAKAINSNRTIS